MTSRFLGLTLIYCLRHASDFITPASISALESCSIMLYVMTTRWPGASRFRDAFDTVKKSVSDLLFSGSQWYRTNNNVHGVESGFSIESLDQVFEAPGIMGADYIYDVIMGEPVVGQDWAQNDWGFSIDNLGTAVPVSFKSRPGATVDYSLDFLL